MGRFGVDGCRILMGLSKSLYRQIYHKKGSETVSSHEKQRLSSNKPKLWTEAQLGILERTYLASL